MIQRLSAMLIRPFKTKWGTETRDLTDRLGDNVKAQEFTEFKTDVMSALRKALDLFKSEKNPAYPDQYGGTVSLPRGVIPATSTLVINEPAVSVKGDGVASTFIDMKGAAIPGIRCIDTVGLLYGTIEGFSVANAQSAIRGERVSRANIRNVEAYVPSGDGFLFDRFIMSGVENCFVTGGKSHGINMTYDDPAKEKTSIVHARNWVRNTTGIGHILGNFSYSVSYANGVDGGGSHAYVVKGVSKGGTLLSNGAESCKGSGVFVDATSATDDIDGLLISGFYGRDNNKTGTDANLVKVQAGNGGKATVIIDRCVSRTQSGASAGMDIQVIGSGAKARINGSNRLDFGIIAKSGGLIDYTPVTEYSTRAIATGTATPICQLVSSHGYGLRLGGEVTVEARNTHPSEATGKYSIYKLLVSATDNDGARVQVLAQAGYNAATGNAVDNPSFTFSLNDSRQLMATPQGGVGGGSTFHFQIVTDRLLRVLPASLA